MSLLIREPYRTGLVGGISKRVSEGAPTSGPCRGQRGIPHDDDDERHADSSSSLIRFDGGRSFPDQPHYHPGKIRSWMATS